MLINAIYIRTSTEQQTPELQLKDIYKLHPPQDAIIIKEQLSAWKENVLRPEFEKLIKQIKARQVATIYVWNIDRLYRNRRRLLEFLMLCRNYEVKVFSYNQQWLDSIQKMEKPWNEIMFDLMLQIVGWIAEDESKTKSNRVKMAVVKKESGTYSHRNKKWGRKPFSQQTVSRVLQLHEEGKSIRSIAALVQVYDKSKNGQPISKSGVHKIIAENAVKKGSKKACPLNN